MSTPEAFDHQEQVTQLNQQVIQQYRQGRYPEAAEVARRVSERSLLQDCLP